MRQITAHQINEANTALRITATDEPSAAGANNRYEVTGMDSTSNPSAIRTDPIDTFTVLFQNGPINSVGVNGLTNEALLAILADRLGGFQRGPFACGENAAALEHIEHAQHYLQRRTRERLQRGVEGTHVI
jgi:hypothetical protein